VLGFTYFVVGIAGPAQVVGGGARREDAGGALCLTSAGVVVLAENDISVRTENFPFDSSSCFFIDPPFLNRQNRRVISHACRVYFRI
jgi:hypothetical protein